MNTRTVDVAVVGAGIAGLSLGFWLQRQGARVVVLEKGAHPGGTLRTLERDGFLLETGANTFLDKEPATRRLLQALGLEEKIRFADPASKHRFLFHQGVLHRLPSSPPAFLKSNVLTWKGKLRALCEPFSSKGSGEDETLTQFGLRHLGEEATRVLLDAAQSGIYAGDPDALSFPSAFPKLFQLEQEHRSVVLGLMRDRKKSPPPASLTGQMCSLEGGLGTLPNALGAALGDSLRLSEEVTHLQREASGPYRLTLRSGETLVASRVALAIPAFAAAALLQNLDAALAEVLRSIPYAPLAAVHLAFAPQTATSVPAGFGALAPYSEGLNASGILFISSTFPWRAPPGHTLLTVMVGGARRPEVLEWDEAGLIERVRETVRRVLGVSDAPSFVHIVRWPRAIPQYNVGHAQRLDAVEKRLESSQGLVLLGNAYRGVGLNDCIRDAEAVGTRLLRADG